MRKLSFITILILLGISCEKDKFDIDNPDVEIFVKEIKNGTYNYYEKEKQERIYGF